MKLLITKQKKNFLWSVYSYAVKKLCDIKYLKERKPIEVDGSFLKI